MDLVESLRPVYAEWARGNFAWPDVMDEHVEFVPLELLPETTPIFGRAAVGAYMRRIFELFGEYAAEATGYEQAGDRVLVRVRQWGVARTSGLPVEMDYFQVWTFRDGRVTRLENVKDEAAARRAAGLA